nr:hypothetical protein [Tanacetum cinerariifolium]
MFLVLVIRIVWDCHGVHGGGSYNGLRGCEFVVFGSGRRWGRVAGCLAGTEDKWIWRHCNFSFHLGRVDTFYVTGYDEHGSEIGRYNDLMMQQRRSRILVTLGNDLCESPVSASTNLDYGHVLYGLGWENLNRCFDFTNGKTVVLTNMLGNDLRVLVFGDDGYEINHENLPRTKAILDLWLRKKLRKGHSVVYEDEEVVFYQTLSHHVKNEGSLAFPPDFITANDLFIFKHAKIVYGKKSYKLELHREFYNDDPSHVNDMKLIGNWRRISRRYMFGKNKTIRINIYHYAEIDWYDLDDSETFSINGYDAMLEDLGIKDGSILFSHFRIPRKSLDEGLVSLISNQDVLSLLQYVPIYKEIKVYVEKNTMEVVLGTGKGVVIGEVVEDDEVKEASKTGNSGKQLLSMTENDVQTKTEPSTPSWSFESLSDSNISDHPPWSSESMNEKRNKRLKMKNEVKAEQEMEEPVHNDFHPLMNEVDLLQKEDPVKYQQDPYNGEDEAEENAELFDEQDHLLEHVPFLKEIVIIVDCDAPLLAVDALVVPPVIVLDEQLERPNKRRKLNPA